MMNMSSNQLIQSYMLLLNFCLLLLLSRTSHDVICLPKSRKSGDIISSKFCTLMRLLLPIWDQENNFKPNGKLNLRGVPKVSFKNGRFLSALNFETLSKIRLCTRHDPAYSWHHFQVQILIINYARLCDDNLHLHMLLWWIKSIIH